MPKCNNCNKNVKKIEEYAANTQVAKEFLDDCISKIHSKFIMSGNILQVSKIKNFELKNNPSASNELKMQNHIFKSDLKRISLYLPRIERLYKCIIKSYFK